MTFLACYRLGNDTSNIQIHDWWHSWLVTGLVTESHQSCICVLEVSFPSLYQARKVISHVFVCYRYRYQACIKPGKSSVMYLCVRGIVHTNTRLMTFLACYRLGNDTSNTQIHDWWLSWLVTGLVTIPLTHKYMTVCMLEVSLPSL
jgi:hypothetical protein